MTRAVLCSLLLLSLSCSSSRSDGGEANGAGNVGAAGGQGGSGNAGGSSNAGGSDPTGSAGCAAAGTGGNAPAVSDGSVTQRGGDVARTSHWVHASLTKANMSRMAQDTFPVPAGTAEYAGKFAGEVAATPLYLAGADGGPGEYIVVTTQNDVYAFRETTGALLWKHNIGAFLMRAICGTPSTYHGIVSTPVIDAAARVIYLAGTMADSHHEIHALAADTGLELAGGWPVDVSKISTQTATGALAFEPVSQSLRSALSLVNGVVYVAFGGYCGDGGNYHGWVVAVDSKDPSKLGAWATIDKQAGIWAPGGMASDGNGVFAVTGNALAAQGTDHSATDSEEIIRISGLGVGHRDAKNLFFPSEWSTPMNANDRDFGSSSPAVITVPNSTPATVIVAPAKPGRVYFLDAGNLGASLGQFADMAVAGTNGSSVFTAPSVYPTASGIHVAITTGGGSQCPAPVGLNNGSLMSILMQPGVTPDKAPTPKMVWCAKIGTVDGDATTTRRAPSSTNSVGSADPIVWLMNGSKLSGFDGETGAAVYDSGAATCGGVHTFTQVIAANGHIVTAGDIAGQAHLCSWSVHN